MKVLTFFFILLVSCKVSAQQLPEGFVYLNTIDDSIQLELRYITSNNFIGKPIDGYKNNIAIVSIPTAKALHEIQTQLLKDSDAYRPQQAVNHFVKWAKDLNDTIVKAQYYPDVKKSELFKKGFIASKSGHTRGSTVDLTIVNLKTGKELDMGSAFDFFGAISHPFSNNINNLQKKNRMLLRKVMLSYNFKPYENEWWHFTLKNEPFPDTYFNFPVE